MSEFYKRPGAHCPDHRSWCFLNGSEDSQEQRDGKAIGQAGRDTGVPDGQKGSHQPKNHPDDRHIPNQESSSASNQRKDDSNRGQD